MIDECGFGYIIIDGKRYTNDVIVFPGRVEDNWWRKVGHQLQVKDLEVLVEEKPEVLVIGTGYNGLMKISSETVEFLRSEGVEPIIQETRDACRTYNNLVESKKVVAALHLAC
ncbi:MAG: Mth938-like domain-containing protein [Candidatus Bathyarchaeota archaeon]|nr:MAG: Mth938-like domain-containing protein [Candidatus Bathyarchaeota archaeon]